MKKIATQGANSILGYLDRLASNVEKNPKFFGLTAGQVAQVVAGLDKVSDVIETGVFGTQSLETRKAEILESEPGETFLDDMDNPQEPILIQPDEPYMKEFNTDTSTELSDVFGSASDWREGNPFV